MQVNTISKGKLHCFLVMVILFISIFLSLSLFLIRLADDNFNKKLSVENSTEGRPAQCEDGYFPCKSNKVECIPQWQQCNQVENCEDGSDEDVCFNAAGATTDIFKKIIESNKTSANDFAWLIPANCDMDRLIEGACPCNLTDVNVIICSQSNLTEVPDNLVETVFKISMSKNSINNIDQVHWPGALKSLALDGNSISEIGEKSFESAPNLSRLYLSNNKIREIHALAFEHLTHLAVLNLDSNRLKRFSSRLIQGKNSLRSLNLTDNQLDLDEAIEFSRAPNIEEIFLEQNQITIIRRFQFSNLTKLSWLTLANNRIEHIENRAFENNYALTELNLAFNRIKVVDRRMFAHRLNIHRLYLDGNPIEQLPVDAFRELLELRSLNLTQIEFSTLQRENFNYLALLKFIYFEHFAYCYYAPNVRVCRPITDGISTGDQLLASINLKYAVWVVAVVCSLGNIIVLIWRSISKHEDEALSLFVRNLSVADLMMGLYLCTIAYMDNEVFKSKFRQFSSNWLSSWTCSAIGTLAIFSSELSVFLLTIITVERYRAIVSIKRFEPETFMRRARISIALAWFLSFLIALYPLLDWILQESSSVFYATNGLCLPLHIDQPYGRGWKYSALVYVFINFSAVMLMICLYARMYMIIIGGHQTAKPHLLGGERREEAILAIRFFFIVITDCLCWIPIVVIKIIAMKMTISSSIYGWLVVFIIPINSALNPIVYTLANPNTLFCRLLNRINNRLNTLGAWSEAAVEASWPTITRLVTGSRALAPSRSRSARVPRGSNYSTSRSSNSISNGSEAQLMNNTATSGGRRRTSCDLIP